MYAYMKYKNNKKEKKITLHREDISFLDDVQRECDHSRAIFVKSYAVLAYICFTYRSNDQLVLLLSCTTEDLVI